MAEIIKLSDIAKDTIIVEDTGEIVAEVIYCPEAIGMIDRPFNLIMNGESLGFYSSKEAINEHISRVRQKTSVSPVSGK